MTNKLDVNKTALLATRANLIGLPTHKAHQKPTTPRPGTLSAIIRTQLEFKKY